MQSIVGKDKRNILPPEQQIHITLETQEEIDQLFAMLDFVPIMEAINVEDSAWINLREKLARTENCFEWYSLLNDHF